MLPGHHLTCARIIRTLTRMNKKADHETDEEEQQRQSSLLDDLAAEPVDHPGHRTTGSRLHTTQHRRCGATPRNNATPHRDTNYFPNPARRSASAMDPAAGASAAPARLPVAVPAALSVAPRLAVAPALSVAPALAAGRSPRRAPPRDGARRTLGRVAALRRRGGASEPMRWRGTSTSRTFTLTTSPDLTTSCGSLTKLRDIADTCTRPSWCTPTSTNAPNAATLVTTPSSTIPGFRSRHLLDARREGRGLELRARVASRLLEFGDDVGDGRQPELVVDEVVRTHRTERRGVAEQFAHGRPAALRRSGAPPGRPRGARSDASSGSSPSGMRRKPAHCSNALGPSRATSLSALRLGNGPFWSRCATMLSASDDVTPETRESSGTDAVLTSTPTAFTASSTTAPSDRASIVSETSCWYCPTPMDLGSILTSSASGSCRRRAIDTAPRIDTSRSGSSCEAYADAEYTDAPASETTIFVRLGVPELRDQFGGERVGLARRRAVADGDQFDAVLRDELRRGSPATGPTCCAAGAGRSCRGRRPCRWRRRRRPWCRCGSRGPGPWWDGSRRARRAEDP